MRALYRLWRRLRETVNPSPRDDEFGDEIELHIRMLTEDNVRAGMEPDEARRAAVLRFGSVESTKEQWRDQRRLPLMETVIRDLHYAWRTLRTQSRVGGRDHLHAGVGHRGDGGDLHRT